MTSDGATEYAGKPTDELESIYLSGADQGFDREEALWEYWSRVFFGSHPFSLAALRRAMTTELAMLGNVLGYLAERDMLPDPVLDDGISTLTSISSRSGGGAAEWGARMLAGRRLLRDVEAGRLVWSGDLVPKLLGKGLSWAVIECLALLAPSDQRSLATAALGAPVFSRRQKAAISDAMKEL